MLLLPLFHWFGAPIGSMTEFLKSITGIRVPTTLGTTDHTGELDNWNVGMYPHLPRRRSLPDVQAAMRTTLFSFLPVQHPAHRYGDSGPYIAEGSHASHKAGLAAAGAPPSTNAFTDRATSLFIAAVSADCSASSLSTAPSAHLVRVRLGLGLGFGLGQG